MSIGWLIWFVPVLIGIAGPYFQLRLGYATFFGGAIMAIVSAFNLVSNPIGGVITAIFLGLPLLFVVIFAFLIGGGLTYVTYYIAAKFMDIDMG
jgi:Zn-dependent protease